MLEFYSILMWIVPKRSVIAASSYDDNGHYGITSVEKQILYIVMKTSEGWINERISVLSGVGCVKDEIGLKNGNFMEIRSMRWQEMQGIPHGSLTESKFPFLLHSSESSLQSDCCTAFLLLLFVPFGCQCLINLMMLGNLLWPRSV